MHFAYASSVFLPSPPVGAIVCIFQRTLELYNGGYMRMRRRVGDRRNAFVYENEKDFF